MRGWGGDPRLRHLPALSTPSPRAENVIKVTDLHAWVYLRICVPNEADSLSGRASMGGVPLPTIKLYEYGKAVPDIVQPCPLKAPQPSQDYYPVRSMNKFADVRALLQLWFPDGSDLNQASDHDDVLPDDRVWFAPPWRMTGPGMPGPLLKMLGADVALVASRPAPGRSAEQALVENRTPADRASQGQPESPAVLGCTDADSERADRRRTTEVRRH